MAFNFLWFLASFFLRLIGFFMMLVLSILLLIVGSWFISGQVAAEFLARKDLNIIALNSKLAYAAGILCLVISLYLLGSGIVLGNLMFTKRDLKYLKKGRIVCYNVTFKPQPQMESAEN